MSKNVDDCTEEELLAALAKRRAGGGFSDLSELEDELETLATNVKRVSLEASSNSIPSEEATPKPCPKCGKKTRVRRRSV